jgi:glycine cleavage system aminomethyltransferase T
MAGVAARQRAAYEALLAGEAPFGGERPAALFSPAAAAQDDANPKGGYGRFAQVLLPLEYSGWVEESQAHVRSAYLGDWTSLSKVAVRGRQAREFLSQAGLNDLSRFEAGQVKHHVQLDEHGWVASEGVLVRLGEEDFTYTAGSCDWLAWRFSQDNWDAELADVSPETFIFGVQGPVSLLILEKACGEGLRDIGFNRSRAARAGGLPVRVLRTGISGELGYELHGAADDAGPVWRAVADAGRGHGLSLLGFRSQPVQHIEAGIATNGLDYLPAAAITPGSRPTGWTTFRRRRSRPERPGSSAGARSAAASSRPAASLTTSASPASWAGRRAPCPGMTSSAGTRSPPTPPAVARPACWPA